ncbi:DUF4394 domain-containing protein [Actinophytocola oryzae]|uniref:Uncharacterized protein DUF4394 n=1 Tax=Actinophytocola oryzae TaxID=502181 RepID=A0A4R7W6Y8_9PSEU|nr:DUF4394 domain-containing protein [Actinophytocola oryzae]TDV57799.1 uncharacterized protein DUF4394 [Actinophytocola oryzae]
MTSRIKKGIIAAVTAVGAAAALTIGTAGSSTATTPSVQAVGITQDGTLMAAFYTNTPQVLDWVQVIQGLSGDVTAVGIDWRVQNRTLYLVGDKGGIYTVAVPTTPGQPVVARKVSQLTVPLYGTSFGVDFNPAADRLRVISDNGQNLRHNLNDNTTVEDSTLNNNGSPARGVTGAAYTNNDLNADTATTLFDVNTLLDQVVIQSPPNAGSLAATGALTVDAGLHAGFDIYSDTVNGKTVANFGFAALVTPDNKANLYDVNLLTGTVTRIGTFPLSITSIAIPLDNN